MQFVDTVLTETWKVFNALNVFVCRGSRSEAVVCLLSVHRLGRHSTRPQSHLLEEGHKFCDYLYFLHSVLDPDAFQEMQFYSCLYLCKKNEINKMIKKQFDFMWTFICTSGTK